MKKIYILYLATFILNIANAQKPTILKDINTYGNGSILTGHANYTTIGNIVFFTAGNNETGTELYSTDGTKSGTKLFKDLINGPISSKPSGLTNVNGVLYLSAKEQIYGQELWKSDGTWEGTKLFLNLAKGGLDSYPSLLTNVNGVLYFTADGGHHRIYTFQSY